MIGRRARRGVRPGFQHTGALAAGYVRPGRLRPERRGGRCRCRTRACLGRLRATQPGVPQHGQQQAEAEQDERPGDDRDRCRRGAVRKPGTGGVQCVRARRGTEQREHRKPCVAAHQQPGAAQGQDRGRGDHQHRIEDQRVELGQPWRDPGRQRDCVNPRIREHERGGRQHQHAEDDGDQGDEP